MTSTLDTLRDAKTIVIKIGSVLICDKATNAINTPWFETLAQDIKALTDQGKRIIIVSSGGVALGREALNIAFDMPPAKIPLAQKQAASAVGQYHMYNAYHNALSQQDIATAQVLLTLSETENRRMYLNARATLETLMDKNIIPVINENDTITTEEIRFGDNDRLAVRVGQMVGADSVILLSTIDGLYTDNPHDNPDATHIPTVSKITDEHKAMATEATPGLSTGGMKSKIQAAINAVNSGMSMVITDGRDTHSISALFDNDQKRSTLFTPHASRSTARKNWIGSHLKPAGEVVIDNGAKKALLSGKSLLLVGVTAVSGTFERGDIVVINDQSGHKIAMGISAYSAVDATKVMGLRSDDILEKLGFTGRSELIHRNDLALHE